jgi:hypothetical protein
MRKATLQLTYENKDISQAIASRVVRWSYTDHAEGQADDLQITLHNRSEIWTRAWWPSKGATLKASVMCNDWDSPGHTIMLSCGTFTIDEIECSGPPNQVTLKAVSSLVTTSMRREKKSRAWENTSLRTVGEQLVADHGVKLFWEGEDVTFARLDQREESDLAFLQRVAKNNGLSVKVGHGRIIIYEGKTREASSPVYTVSKAAPVSAYSFSTTAHDIYRACKVKYWDAATKSQMEYVFTPDNGPDVGQTLQVNKRVESLAEAMRQAETQLRAKNKAETTASITLMGRPELLSGLVYSVEGFGKFDGNYMIDEATHSGDGSTGYTTSITSHLTLGY